MKVYHTAVILQLFGGLVVFCVESSEKEIAKRDLTPATQATIPKKRVLLNEAARYLDNQISEIEEQLGGVAERARQEVSVSTRKSNLLGISYGSAIVAANLFYTWAAIYGKSQADLTPTDYTLMLANSGYAYGYGAPFLAEGQLESTDPGCGAQEIYQALDQNYLPPLYQLYSVLETADGSVTPALLIQPQYSTINVRQMARERSTAVKDAASCLTGSAEGVELKSLISRLDSAISSRLDVTDNIIKSLKQENAELYV